MEFIRLLEEHYSGIGKKIKRWAIWIFVIEAIAAIIAGIIGCVIFCDWGGDDGGYLWAFLCILAIPLAILIEFVGTWLLYGFGELIDKTVENERNTRDILNILKKSPSKSTDHGVPKTQAKTYDRTKSVDKKTNKEKNEDAPKESTDAVLLEDLYNEDSFKCPKCGKFVYYGETKCKNCGEEFDTE